MEWGLRDYGDTTKVKWDNWEGQLGLESHPQMYIDHLVEIFREVRRVLKGSGSLWLNLGDTYYGSGKGIGGNTSKSKEIYQLPKENKPKYNYDGKWLQPKQKMLIPERVAIALQEDGWILRNKIIWYKPNAMPSSVKDRLNTTYESIFFFVKQRKYYFDLDSIKVPLKSSSLKRLSQNLEQQHGGPKEKAYVKENIIPAGGDIKSPSKILKRMKANYEKSGYVKNPGDMWEICTKPFKGAHFAVYPTTLIERILKCTGLKEGIVLDTFMGSGTTALVAKQQGLNWIGIELNEKYAKEIAIPRIGSGTVETYKVNRSKISKGVKASPKVSSNVPIGDKPQCNYKELCNFKINSICYMDKKKRVKYCPGIKQ